MVQRGILQCMPVTCWDQEETQYLDSKKTNTIFLKKWRPVHEKDTPMLPSYLRFSTWKCPWISYNFTKLRYSNLFVFIMDRVSRLTMLPHFIVLGCCSWPHLIILQWIGTVIKSHLNLESLWIMLCQHIQVSKISVFRWSFLALFLYPSTLACCKFFEDLMLTVPVCSAF